MAIQSYSWFRTSSQSAYAQVEAHRQKLHAYNQDFLDAASTLTDNLFAAGVTQSSGMATITAKIAAKRVSDAIQANINKAQATVSSALDVTV